MKPKEVRVFRFQAVRRTCSFAFLVAQASCLLPLWMDARPARAETVVTTPVQTYGLGPLRCAIYTPDATKIIAAGDFWGITLLDAATGRILRTFTGHTGGVNALACSPNGLRLLSGGDDGTARLWDLATGNELQTFRESSAVRFVALSPDASTCITATGLTIRLWTTTQTLMLLKTKSECVAFSHDGQTVAAGSGNNVCVWDAATGELRHTFSDHLAEVLSVAFSPDDRIVLAGSHDKTAISWNIATEEIAGYYAGSSGSVSSADFFPDGNTLFTVTYTTNITLWNAATGVAMKTVSAPSITDAVLSTGGQKFLALYAGVCRLQQMKAADGAPIDDLYNYTASTRCVAFMPDGNSILTGHADKIIRRWDLQTGNPIRFFTGCQGPVLALAVSPDGRRIMAAGESWSNKAQVWNVDSETPFRENGNLVESIAFSPDGSRIALGQFYEFRCLDAQTFNTISTKFNQDGYGFRAARFMPDNRTVILGSFTSARLIDSNTGGFIRNFFGHTGYVSGVDAFPGGDRVLTGSLDGSCRIWNVANGFPVRTFQSTGQPVNAVAVSPDGRHILTGSDALRLYDASSGELLMRFQHNATVYSVAFSPDGGNVLSGASDGRARLWNLPVVNHTNRFWQNYE